MEEKVSKMDSRELYFESSGQKLKITIELNDIFKEDLHKSKDFFEGMFKEILKTIC